MQHNYNCVARGKCIKFQQASLFSVESGKLKVESFYLEILSPHPNLPHQGKGFASSPTWGGLRRGIFREHVRSTIVSVRDSASQNLENARRAQKTSVGFSFFVKFSFFLLVR